jgi:hypothetical protein
VVCFVDFRGDPTIRDVAQTLYERSSESFQVSARGYGYLVAFNREDFLKGCKALNLEFVVPNAEPEKTVEVNRYELRTPNGSAPIINLAPRETECCICGKLIIDGHLAIAMYEGCVVPHDWKGDWAGFPACRECFDKHERGELPLWPNPPTTRILSTTRTVWCGSRGAMNVS